MTCYLLMADICIKSLCDKLETTNWHYTNEIIYVRTNILITNCQVNIDCNDVSSHMHLILNLQPLCSEWHLHRLYPHWYLHPLFHIIHQLWYYARC